MKEVFLKYKFYFISGIAIALLFIILGIFGVISVPLAVIVPFLLFTIGGSVMALKKGNIADDTTPVNKLENLSNEYFKYSSSDVTVHKLNDSLPSLINVKQLDVIYTSTNEYVATVNNFGYVKILHNGQTIIKAHFPGNNQYFAKTASYNLTVDADTNECPEESNINPCTDCLSDYQPIEPIDISDDDFKYEFDFVKITEEDDYESKLPKLINNKKLEGVVVTSTDHNVAKFNKYGNVVIVGNGRTIITSFFEGNSEYNYKEASYELIVDIVKHKKEVDELLEQFKEYVDVKEGSVTYNYLIDSYTEAHEQFYKGKSVNKIPSLYKEELFPNVMNFYGDEGTEERGFKSFVGWLFALTLIELKPTKRNEILKIGYEYGGYDRYSNIFGYKFKADPNVARIVAADLYAALKGVKKPDTDIMREEIGGTVFTDSLETIKESDNLKFGENNFYPDLREFMPTAPGPYAPSYKKRPDVSYPNEPKDEYDNNQIDRNIHEFIVENYNLGNPKYEQATVQAIADKEGDPNHLFGPDREAAGYKFHAVFGNETIGREISPEGDVAKLSKLVQYISSYTRNVLQSTKLNPKQYGRLRPGCSWEKETAPNSSNDPRRNTLCYFPIEDNDGCPTGYYNKQGKWVYPDKVKSEKDFVKYYQKYLYANSYPSGHSSSMQGLSMVLVELMPELADKIMNVANQFAINRTIARYHWTSDTINGRVLGSISNALCHAVVEFKERFNKAKEELNS